MIDKMRELTDRQMLDFVKELEKRRIPLHSVLIAQHGKLIHKDGRQRVLLYRNRGRRRPEKDVTHNRYFPRIPRLSGESYG